MEEALYSKYGFFTNEKVRSKKSGDLNLSDISVIGEARKDKSEIISFFFDLFDNDSDEVDPINKEQLKMKI